MDLLNFLTRKPNPLNKETAIRFAAAWHIKHVEKAHYITMQGEVDPMEIIILDGRATSQITDSRGQSVCVGFHNSPCVVAPNVARTRDGISLVSLEVTSGALIAQLDSNKLTEFMLASEPIRDWANDVLQKELAHKTNREWCLAALGGARRLTWFRENFPDHEEFFDHYLIASYLGMTPVTLSRLRAAERD